MLLAIGDRHAEVEQAVTRLWGVGHSLPLDRRGQIRGLVKGVIGRPCRPGQQELTAVRRQAGAEGQRRIGVKGRRGVGWAGSPA